MSSMWIEFLFILTLVLPYFEYSRIQRTPGWFLFVQEWFPEIVMSSPHNIKSKPNCTMFKNLECPRTLDPVCANDRITYANDS
ncbi:serine protease inhibitor Kazal-type 11-like [Rattus norvegicus]|uniref:serine protease inhibitor Kazal-type 11-like n=1 Tax=Rattus norvegicus TaxID=10116 RepID=UPI00191711D2|nr:serine protease inhibitor Kazal-type 11-like [Rattus norvegicus]